MRLRSSTAFFASLLAGASLGSAALLQDRGTKLLTLLPSLNPAGAVFFMTNEPDENVVMVASINRDGSLRLERAVSTGGGGAHGISDPIGADGLFAQSGIKASQKGQVLATVNPGSNTISLFSINPKVPTDIQQIGNPISSEGEFPMSLTFNDAGSRLCVLNGGTVSGVNCFTVDKKAGLKAIPNSLRSLALNQTNPPNGPPGSASQILFSPDGTQLLASAKGNPPLTSGFIAVWDNALVNTDPNLGFAIIDLAGNRSQAVAIEGQGATCWSSMSAQTGNFYLTDVGTATVTEVSVDDNLQPTIVKQYKQVAGSGTIDNDIATVGGKDFLYILAANAATVDILALKGPGRAESAGRMDIAGLSRLAGVPITPVNLQGMTHFITE
ncbi:hypothetical protein C8Q80DRAFT_1264165 [Daedaleopsis nitida]|nr:hypothetical protein C8Q80DRAFT_1264165 [Daedaleopsis nitida]